MFRALRKKVANIQGKSGNVDRDKETLRKN